MKEKEFVKGLYPKKKRNNAPDFVLGGGSIKVDDMILFLQEKKATGEIWINYDVLQPRDETKNPYALVNNWKPENKQEDDQLNEIPF